MVAEITDIRRETDYSVSVTVLCPLCEQSATVPGVDAYGFEKWLTGTIIQYALPQLSSAQRETLISGAHEECLDPKSPWSRV